MRYVIALDAALRLVRDRQSVPTRHRLVAPTLLRSQLLSELFQSVKRGECDRNEAAARLDYMRALKIRLLGDRVLQGEAWKIADELGWPDTLQAEYVALTRLQGGRLCDTRHIARAIGAGRGSTSFVRGDD